MKKEKMILFLLIASAGLVLILTGAYFFSGKKIKKKTVPATVTKKPTITALPAEKENLNQALFLITSVNTEQQIISLHGFDQEDVEVSYGTITEFLDKYGTMATPYSFLYGDIVLAEIDTDGELKRLQRSKDHFELHGVEEFSISSQAVKINGINYQLTEKTFAFDKNGQVDIGEVRDIDRIQVCGRGSEILSIEVMKGHGSIKLTNSENFQGAKVTFGGESHILEGEPSFLVREGTYQVVVTGEKEAAAVSVTVAKDEQQVIDLYEYGGKPLQMAEVRFHVSPFATVLTIDGEKQDYFEKDIPLSFGEHEVTAELGGFITYNGKITITKTYQSFSIGLVEKKTTETEGGEETGSSTEAGSENAFDDGEETGGDSETGEKEDTEGDIKDAGKDGTGEDSSILDRTGIGAALDFTVDHAHNTYILVPVGAKVKLDGVSIGTAPVKFEKIIGSYSITLTVGEKEKTFQVASNDDKADVTWILSMD